MDDKKEQEKGNQVESEENDTSNGNNNQEEGNNNNGNDKDKEGNDENKNCVNVNLTFSKPHYGADLSLTCTKNIRAQIRQLHNTQKNITSSGY